MGGTMEIAAAAAREWDVLVIGAGPAGGVAALSLARRGASVLLVDRAAWPREKVCGCCLSEQGAAMLDDAGARLPIAAPFRGVVIRCGRRSAGISSRGGLVVTRRDLDCAIARAAVKAGATFIPACTARVVAVPPRGVAAALGCHGLRAPARAVIAADGVGGRSLDELPEFQPRVVPRSRFGASVTLDAAPSWVERGVVQMVVGAGGYVGAVRLDDRRTHIAAALEPASTRGLGGPSHAAAAILRSAGVSLPGIEEARWHATPALTRSRRVQRDRVFVVGDAAGYVEPFTGEGMTWAIAGGLAVVPHVQAALAATGPAPQTWAAGHSRLLAGRHRACRAVSVILRTPGLVRATLAAGGVTRALARLLEPGRIWVPA